MKRSIESQISYLNNFMILGGDNALQSRYPEGKVFANTIFSLSLIEYSEKTDKNRSEIAAMIDRCLKTLLSSKSKSIFQKNISPTYGAFYNGWTNYTLSRYLKSKAFLHSNSNSILKNAYSDISESIIEAQKDSIVLLETYYDAIWPGDNLACIASLPSQYDSLKVAWLTKLIDESNNEMELIDHFIKKSGEVRGSSQALMLFFMADFENNFIPSQNQVYTNNFVDNILGVELVKEFHSNPKGMDIDSGPIVFGYGAVATIMNIKAQTNIGKRSTKWTWAVLNTVGLPLNLFGNKYYLQKREPMFDLFMLWSSVSL